MNNRLEYNRLILEELSKKVEEYPMLRFGQLLWRMNILYTINNSFVDPFYEESEDIYNRMMLKGITHI